VVMEQGSLAGMLTFREVLLCTVKHAGVLSEIKVREAMDAEPRSVAPDTELDEVRRLMLESHARYIPVLEGRVLMGVISFYDVARAIVESQNFENRMLKAYIRDWPVGEEQTSSGPQL
jgi:CBS domain-containing protein